MAQYFFKQCITGVFKPGRLVCLVITLLFVFPAFAQTSLTIAPDTARIQVLFEKAHQHSLSAEEKKEFRLIGYGIQNRGFAAEEKEHNYDKALDSINKALIIWTALDDTLNEANNRKYRGYLLGHLKKFPEAKTEINRAIGLFEITKKD
jgi:tetratricopeptide (TPR) repeat protein